MPTSALTTNLTVERCTRRTASSATATTTLALRATVRLRVVSQSTVKTRVGTAASIIPRRPPSAWPSCWRTNDSTVSVVGAPVWWAGTAGSWVIGRSRQQLVTRVVDDPVATVPADPALDLQRPAGRDGRDLAAPEPDQHQGVGAVEQLGLEGRHPAPGPERDRLERAAQAHRLAVLAVGDEVAVPLARGGAQLAGVHVV